MAFKINRNNFSKLNIEMDLGSTEVIKTYLRNSESIAFLPIHSIANDLSNNVFQIVEVEGLHIERFFYFIERQGSTEQLANLFMHFASRYLGRYNLQIGGDRIGERLNKLYKESLDETELLTELDYLFGVYATERANGETFGDFSHRKWLNSVPLIRTASTFSEINLPKA